MLSVEWIETDPLTHVLVTIFLYSWLAEFYRDHTKIQGFWKKKNWILFSQQEFNSFSPEFYCDHTKIQALVKLSYPEHIHSRCTINNQQLFFEIHNVNYPLGKIELFFLERIFVCFFGWKQDNFQWRFFDLYIEYRTYLEFFFISDFGIE